MIGVSVNTALQIFCNPNDLCITIGRSAQNNRLAFEITRGPGHHYISLVTFDAHEHVDDMKVIIQEIQNLLEAVRSKGIEILGEEGDILTPSYIESIITALRQRGTIATFARTA